MPRIGDDPVPRGRRSPAPRRPHDRSPRTPELHRRPEPESANNNSRKRNGDVDQQPQRRPGRLEQVALPQSSLESARASLARVTTASMENAVLHLASHGVKRNADGSYSWKFDEYQRARAPYRLSPDDHIALWSRITCHTLLLRGKESFLPDPETAGVLAHFRQVRLVTIVGAGHWLHHDKLDEVLGELCPFLGI